MERRRELLRTEVFTIVKNMLARGSVRFRRVYKRCSAQIPSRVENARPVFE